MNHSSSLHLPLDAVCPEAMRVNDILPGKIDID